MSRKIENPSMAPTHAELEHAIRKAQGDREAALRYVCRLYGVRRVEQLPDGVLAAASRMIAET